MAGMFRLIWIYTVCLCHKDIYIWRKGLYIKFSEQFLKRLINFKVLRNWGQKSLANHLNEAGRRLLALETAEAAVKDQKDLDKGTTLDTSAGGEDTAGSINLQVTVNYPQTGTWHSGYNI
jgi:hypothetical protein